MAEQNGNPNPTPAAVVDAAGPDNSGAAAGTGQEQVGSLLTGNTETKPTAGNGTDPASQDSALAAPKQRPAWKAQVTKELQDDESLDRFPTISELGKSYRELEGKLGRSVEIPGENATAEEVEAYYKKIGRPDTPDDYEFDRPELPQGAIYDEALEKEFRTFAHERGLTKKQAADLWNLQSKRTIDLVNNHQAAQRAELEATKATIRKTFGENADRELAMTQNFMRTTAEKIAPGIGRRIEESGLGNSIELVRLMNHFAHRTSEDSFARNGEGSNGSDARQFDYSTPSR